MSVIWRGVTFCPDKFKVSSCGKVKRIAHKTESGVRLAERDCTVTISKSGYETVSIYGKNYRIHRLVAAAFIPNPFNKEYVNHKNSMRRDNNVSNLEWVTARENCIHASLSGRLVRSNQTKKKISDTTMGIQKIHLRKKVLDMSTGQIISGLTEASRHFNIPVWKLKNQLLGRAKNNVNAKYISDEH